MKNIKRFMAIVLIAVLIFTDGAISHATENTNAAAKEGAEVIENITGTESINTDVYADKDSVAIADGYDVIVDIPKDGNKAVVMDDGEKEKIEMYLPEEASVSEGVLTENGTVVYNNQENSVTIGVQPLQEMTNNVSFEGVRTTITIADSTASKEYEFAYDLDRGSKLITAKELLGDEYDTGEVFIINKNYEITYAIDAPWARDAKGNNIETYYKVKGNKLIQVVNFDENTAFPVVADPSVWKITACVGAIGAVIVGTFFAATKLAKVKKYIKALGGVVETAKLLVGATSVAEKGAACIKAFGSLCQIILGLDTIKSNCL